MRQARTLFHGVGVAVDGLAVIGNRRFGVQERGRGIDTIEVFRKGVRPVAGQYDPDSSSQRGHEE